MSKAIQPWVYGHLIAAHGISARRLIGRERQELQWLEDYMHGRVASPSKDEVQNPRSLQPSGATMIPWPRASYYTKQHHADGSICDEACQHQDQA